MRMDTPEGRRSYNRHAIAFVGVWLLASAVLLKDPDAPELTEAHCNLAVSSGLAITVLLFWAYHFIMKGGQR